MNCPEDIADILLQIARAGVVMARWAAWRNNAAWAAIEASHVHNVPDIIRKYDPEKLVYYWDAERDSYLSQFARLHGQEPTTFGDLWAALEPLMARVRAELPPKASYRAAMNQMVEELVADAEARLDHARE